jgi:hypothetical protein
MWVGLEPLARRAGHRVGRLPKLKPPELGARADSPAKQEGVESSDAGRPDPTTTPACRTTPTIGDLTMPLPRLDSRERTRRTAAFGRDGVAPTKATRMMRSPTAVRRRIPAHEALHSRRPFPDPTRLDAPGGHPSEIRIREDIERQFSAPDGGWLIFKLPPAELTVHPSDGPTGHELFFMCDDLEVATRDLQANGVEFIQDVSQERWGRLTFSRLPGGDEVGIYEPRHPLAIDL